MLPCCWLSTAGSLPGLSASTATACLLLSDSTTFAGCAAEAEAGKRFWGLASTETADAGKAADDCWCVSGRSGLFGASKCPWKRNMLSDSGRRRLCLSGEAALWGDRSLLPCWLCVSIAGTRGPDALASETAFERLVCALMTCDSNVLGLRLR